MVFRSFPEITLKKRKHRSYYAKRAELGVNPTIEWESLRPMVKELYRNDTNRGGGLNIDEIVMIRALSLQNMLQYAR